MKGDWNLILIDSTPDSHYVPFHYKGKLIERFLPTSTFDGENSGQTYDYAISKCTSDIIGMTDPDNFILDPNIISYVEALFSQGYINVGAAGFYDHFQSIFDVANPSHAGWMSPVLWCQFLDRRLAASETFVCNYPGVGQLTGWRVREKIIDQNLSRVTWPGFYKEEGVHGPVTFFGSDQDKPIDVHFLKGSGARSHIMEEIVPPILEREKAKWL